MDNYYIYTECLGIYFGENVILQFPLFLVSNEYEADEYIYTQYMAVFCEESSVSFSRL